MILLALTVLALASFLLFRFANRTPQTAAQTVETRTAADNAADAKAGNAVSASGPELEFLSSDLLVVQPVALNRGVDFAGPLVATTQALVRAKVAGELLELRVREGDTVKAGQEIGRIDSTEAVARHAERQALLASAQAQLDAANKTLENNRNLFDKGFVSQAVIDTSTSNVAVARAQRDAASAQLQVAAKQLGDTRILAPISGQVAERMAQPGERVALDARLLNIVDPSSLEVQASLPAGDVLRVQAGQRAELTIEGLSDSRLGRVSRIAPAALGGSRAVPVFIAIEPGTTPLRPGLYARGRIATGQREPVLAVPQSAVRDSAGRQVVYAISPENRLLALPVQTGASGVAGNRQETWVEILSGLDAGTRVVSVNLGNLKEGAAVRIPTQP